ncbi:MFS general substrate transporter [Suillus fuscotomentosus]|uniref:MFS general substrate transporter n=1 Tax=Suillus fuscotomentosus TaxID=1912939 RepID=A0AAD4EEG1_9AGAM|nr:MFS general substrate transporter [Suillus fuscotomentosus]KAG1904547.1 MFS general substrate transporter [Suillus fuscotomentosus]
MTDLKLLLNQINPFSSRRETSDDYNEEEFKLPNMTSLVIMLVMNFLLQISFFIVISSSSKYTEYLGGNATFSGIVIGIPTAFAGLSLIPLTKYDKDGERRLVAGWSSVKPMGMSFGPFLGGVLYKVGFSNSIFNGYTSPGWIMTGIYAGFWVLMTIYFEDIPQPPTTKELQSASPIVSLQVKGEDTEASPDYPSASTARPASPIDESFRAQLSLITWFQWGVIACMCWFSMLCFFILGSWEANLPVFSAAAENFHWSPFAAGNFIALGAISCFPFLLLNLLAARHIQDRTLLAFGTIIGLAGLIIFLSILRTGKVNYSSLFACWWTVALGFNIATTVTLSLLSKQLPPEWNGPTSILIQCSNYTGRVTGAIWGGSGVSVGMSNFVGLEIAMVGIGAVLFTALWRDLKTKTG